MFVLGGLKYLCCLFDNVVFECGDGQFLVHDIDADFGLFIVEIGFEDTFEGGCAVDAADVGDLNGIYFGFVFLHLK